MAWIAYPIFPSPHKRTQARAREHSSSWTFGERRRFLLFIFVRSELQNCVTVCSLALNKTRETSDHTRLGTFDWKNMNLHFKFPLDTLFVRYLRLTPYDVNGNLISWSLVNPPSRSSFEEFARSWTHLEMCEKLSSNQIVQPGALT